MEDTHEKVGAPQGITVGDRIYELVYFLNEGESSVTGDVMIERAKVLNASLGEEDGKYILDHQGEIPEEFRGKVYLVFPGWRNPPVSPQDFACLDWDGNRWYQRWYWLDRDWRENDRLLRRRM